MELWRGRASGPVDVPFKPGTLSPGRYRTTLEYIEPGYRMRVVEGEMTVIQARVAVHVSLSHNQPWETAGVMDGEITVRSDRDVTGLALRLLAAPENHVDERDPVWEQSLALKAGERRTFRLAFTVGADRGPQVITLAHTAPQLVEVTAEYDIPRTFYISPQGDDSWTGNRPEPAPGIADGPFRTLARARDAIRSLRAVGHLQGPVTVLVRGGTYYLDEPLRFTPDDSGTAAAPITFAAFAGERPVISGGRLVTGWRRREDGLWATHLPEVAAGRWSFRLLRVGQTWATRARYPNADPAQPVTGGWLFAPSGLPDARDRLVLTADTFPTWRDWTEAEVHIFPAWGWVNAILKVTDVDVQGRTLRVESEQDIRPGNRFFIENAREALDSPGEWHLNRASGELLYWPIDPAFPAVDVVAPAMDRLIVLQGDGSRFVEHLRFRGMTFTDADYTAPGGYYTPADAAVWLAGARRTVIEGCTFDNLGGYAVRLEQLSHENEIVGNRMVGLGQGGVVMLGDTASQPHDNLIAANDMEALGRVYKHVSGVYVTTGSGNRIAHNRIRRVPRYGISLKSYDGNAYSHDNIVEFNELMDTNLETNDTGAIETLGRDRRPSGNVIRFNWIRNVVGVGTRPDGSFLTPYFTWGIYLDDYSSGTTVYGNIVSGTVLGALCIHGGRENWVENNIFLDGSERQVTLQPRDDFMQENLFQRNIVVFHHPEAALWYSWSRTWRCDRITSDFNLYWHGGGLDLVETGRPITPEGTLAQWQAAGFDQHSVVADPLLLDIDRDGFRLAPGSPALRLGFEPIPVERIGPRGFQAGIWAEAAAVF